MLADSYIELTKSPGFIRGALKGLGTELGDKKQIEMPALIGLSAEPQPLPPLNQPREGVKDG